MDSNTKSITSGYLEMRKISKQFPGVQALDDVSVKVNQGEILGVVGENGAGKSTLIKILTGVYINNSGQIYINDEEVEIQSPHQARFLYKIAYVSQESALCENLTIAENIVLGFWSKNIFVNWKDVKKTVVQFIESLDINDDAIKPSVMVSELTPANRQLVEIIKALILDSKVLLLDEPTSSMSEEEKKFLFRYIRKLKKQGVAVVFISHFLEEVLELSDKILVLKDGKSMGTFNTSEIDKEFLIHKMLGKKNIKRGEKRKSTATNQNVLETKNICYKNKCFDISFSLKKGEILGITGLLGSGKTELLKVIYGLYKPDNGEVIINDKRQKYGKVRSRINAGVGFITEDRKQEGIIPFLDIAKNITLCSLKSIITFLNILSLKRERLIAGKAVKEFNIKTPGLRYKVANLSGGNQQKVIISKWISAGSEIIILDEPTRGIDVGAKFEIYNLLRREAEKGKSILFVTSELAEILEVPDRFLVLKNGRFVGEYQNGDVKDEKELLHILTA